VSLAQGLSAYAALNAALIVAFAGLLGVEALARRSSPRRLLSTNYRVCAALAVSVFASMALPEAEFFEPSARIWSAPSMPSQSALAPAETAGWFTVGAGGKGFDAGSVGRVWIATVLALLALGSGILLRDVARLRAIARGSQLVRRIGRVSVWINDAVTTPFSYWRPGRAHVVLPSYLIEQPDHLRMVLAHELQHHRQRDTVWLHVFRALRLVCFLNPLAHVWARRVARLQEFACDEALVSRPAYAVGNYARCLLDVALHSAPGSEGPRAATAFIGFGDPKFLRRRIEKMMHLKPGNRTRGQIALVACFLASMTAAAFAAGGWIQDRRVTAEDAARLVARMPASQEFAVVVNDEVLQELNRYAGTPQGREFMRAALQRLNEHQGIVTPALARHRVPVELAAVPIVESGYLNRDESQNRVRGAGLWQFLPNTARVYGLQVDAQVDDRMSPAKLSDAAGRMLQADHLRFGDWQLALIAFNSGGEALQKSIDSTGSRDAWTLVRAGVEGDKGYLARVHAAMIIAANPDMVAK